MKKLAMLAVIAFASMCAFTGCSKSPYNRIKDAMAYLEPDKDRIERDLERIKEMSKDEQLEIADQMDYMVFLKKNGGGFMSDSQLKRTARSVMSGKSPKERKEILSKARKEAKNK